MKDTYTIQDLAKGMNCSYSYAHDLVTSGKVKSIKKPVIRHKRGAKRARVMRVIPAAEYNRWTGKKETGPTEMITALKDDPQFKRMVEEKVNELLKNMRVSA